MTNEGNAAQQAAAVYEPQVVVTKNTEQEAEAFWDRLIREADEADAAEAAGLPALGDDPLPEPAPFEERYERLMAVVSNKPSHREILLRVLALCVEPRELSAVEDAIQAYPEYPATGQNPYRLITYLVDGGGLELGYRDAEGAPITRERQAALTEDELDDLVAQEILSTTDVGRKMAEDLSVERRLSDLTRLFSDRTAHYHELLEFCRQPRTFKDIEALFSGRDLAGLRTLHPESGLAIKPTVFIDNMEKAGAIVWKKDGWVLTKEGGAYLEAIARGSMS